MSAPGVDKSTSDMATELTIEMRRDLVASNLLSGMSYREIANAMQVDKSTIGRDVKAMLKLWKDGQIQKVDEWATLEMKRLDMLHNAIWGNAMDGNLQAIDRVLTIMGKRERFIGITDADARRRSEQENNMDTLQSFLERQDELADELNMVLGAFMNEDGTIEGFPIEDDAFSPTED